MNDLVSVIMPSFNTASYIRESIRSVLDQTYENWELIIVDDCSTDDSVERAASFGDPRIRCFKNETNSGAAVSRNRALREAKGRWIAFLDSDDLWEPEKLDKQIRFMEEKGCSFSYTEYQEIDSDGNAQGILVTGPKKVSRAGMFAYCWPGCLTVMYDAEKVGLIQIADIKKNNDYAMWLKVCKKAECLLLGECLAKYRRGRTGSVSTQKISKLIGWHYRLFREAEKKSALASAVLTAGNLFFGLIKKLFFVKRKDRQEH